jgi:hypothetical protein
LRPEAARALADRLADEGIPARVDPWVVNLTLWEPFTPEEFAAFEQKMRDLASEYGGECSGASSRIDPWE